MFTGQQMLRYEARPGLPHPGCRWVSPTEPPPDLIPSCAEGWVPGPAAGVIGWLQAVEVAKEILGIGDSLSGTRALPDAPSTEVRRVRFARRADCPVRGAAGRNGADHG
jgi:adenylyltransferase/sulfurtransferase